MTLVASYHKHTLRFRFDAGTSRGIMRERDTYFLKVWDQNKPDRTGLGEAGPLKGLSPDYGEVAEYLAHLCKSIQRYDVPESSDKILEIIERLVEPEAPSVRFALESALQELVHHVNKIGFQPIPINGLIWMGDFDFMKEQVDKKVSEGYQCIKIKIGALEFQRECQLLEYIRNRDPELILRVDANGAFTSDQVANRLRKLSHYQLHSIEQPVKPGQVKLLQSLCKNPMVPVALDEELIGITDAAEQEELLDLVQPQYLVLKPTLLGGFHMTDRWIRLADQRGIGWWITSALESNVGLNAIAHYTSSKNPQTHQGLGTGQLYHNNVPPEHLQLHQGWLSYKP